MNLVYQFRRVQQTGFPWIYASLWFTRDLFPVLVMESMN